MRTLRVNMIDVLDAVTAGPSLDGYLDLQSGEVHLVPTESGNYAADELERYDAPDRYARIPKTRDEYEWMRELAESVDEDDVRNRLLDALSGKGAFRRFRDVVLRYPDITARWEALRRERALEIALPLFSDLGIEPVYTLPPLTVPEPAPQPRGPAIDLLDLLVLGAPDGKTEIIDGRALRVVRVEPEVRRAFTGLARQIYSYYGVEWRKRFVEGKNELVMERMRLWYEDDRIQLAITLHADPRFG